MFLTMCGVLKHICKCQWILANILSYCNPPLIWNVSPMIWKALPPPPPAAWRDTAAGKMGGNWDTTILHVLMNTLEISGSRSNLGSMDIFQGVHEGRASKGQGNCPPHLSATVWVSTNIVGNRKGESQTDKDWEPLLEIRPTVLVFQKITSPPFGQKGLSRRFTEVTIRKWNQFK